MGVPRTVKEREAKSSRPSCSNACVLLARLPEHGEDEAQVKRLPFFPTENRGNVSASYGVKAH